MRNPGATGKACFGDGALVGCDLAWVTGRHAMIPILRRAT